VNNFETSTNKLGNGLRTIRGVLTWSLTLAGSAPTERQTHHTAST
jgi:hypothetical protein